MFIRQTRYEPIYEFKYAAKTTVDRKRQKKYINEKPQQIKNKEMKI